MAFRFRLERVLQLRTMQLRSEEFALERLYWQRGQVQAELDALDEMVCRERQRIEGAPYVAVADLLAFQEYKPRAARERQVIEQKLTAQDAAIEKHRGVVVAVKRGISLLEKLKEKRRADWQTEEDRKLGELAADFSAAQWLRGRRELA